MKKLFLLPVIALFVILGISFVSAVTYSCFYSRAECESGGGPLGACYESTGNSCTSACFSQGYTWCKAGSCYVDNPCLAAPEFTTLGAGIAIAGAGVGYWLLRRKRK
ncbi:MAG: hypothetical protein QW041_03495 [Candidatus Pacearchaeota archaeon]